MLEILKAGLVERHSLARHQSLGRRVSYSNILLFGHGWMDEER
jgi:hypothetical protein